MDQTLMQQQISFQHKLGNIRNTNNILDELQKKMNSYFNHKDAQIQKINHTQQVDLLKPSMVFQDEGKIHPSYAMKADRNSSLNSKQSIEGLNKVQFKIYNSQFEQIDCVPQNNGNNDKFRKFKNNKTQHNWPNKEQKDRLSHTTMIRNNGQAVSIDNKKSATATNAKQRKANQDFRLIGRSKQNISMQNKFNTANQDQNINHQNSFKAYKNSYKNQQTMLRNRSQSKNKQLSSSNPVLHEMDTIQIVMKEALQARIRKIKQIQQQIMNQNQQRVYLYKVNVGLNEQFQYLEKKNKQQERNEIEGLEWSRRKLEQDIQNAKKQLQRKKNERKQLRKQEQTMKDGYQTLLNSKKNILRKDIQKYCTMQQKSKQNTNMLKGLIKQLDKLKGVVQSKIKNSKIDHQNNTQKRKVVKSFKN